MLLNKRLKRITYEEEDHPEEINRLLLCIPDREHKVYDQEWNLTDISQSGVASSSAGTGGMFINLQQGLLRTQRIGDEVIVKRVYIQFIFRAGSTNENFGSNTPTIRLFLIQDMQCNAAFVSWSQVFQGSTLPTARLLDVENRRFRCIKEWNATLMPTGVTNAYSNLEQYNQYAFDCDIPVRYTGTSGSIAQLRGHSLFLCAIQWGAVTADILGHSRLIFVDA